MRDPLDSVLLRFRDAEAIEHVDDPIQKDLSTATRCGDALFLSCDETAGVDRLLPVRDAEARSGEP